jgi:hypothetical protein
MSSLSATAALPPMVTRLPVLGWMIEDAVAGREDAKYYFIGNVVLLLGLLVYLFGYPLLIVLALAATAIALGLIVVLTAADMFENRKPRGPAGKAQARRQPH